MKHVLWLMCSLGVTITMSAQRLSEEEAITQALNTHPLMDIANNQLRMQQAMQKSAFNPSQPQLIFEFPNDIGLAFEFQQTFDFPGTYTARAKWLKAQTQRQEASTGITKKELIRDVRLTFLDVQSGQAMVRVLHTQDSLWHALDLSSQRLYDGGHINKADALFASRQAGLVHTQLMQAQLDATNALHALSALTGSTPADVDSLDRLPWTGLDATQGYYFDQYFLAERETAERALAVSRNERLPGIVAGYLRVPEIDTDYRTRFNAGLTIPIWQGQYRSEVTAARIAIESIQAETDLQHLQARARQRQLIETLVRTQEILNWYERNGLPQTDELGSAYIRLYEGGEVDYALTLRNIADALETYVQYLQTLKQHNQAVINLDFLYQN